jgi:hypothetical protein
MLAATIRHGFGPRAAGSDERTFTPPADQPRTLRADLLTRARRIGSGSGSNSRLSGRCFADWAAEALLDMAPFSLADGQIRSFK